MVVSMELFGLGRAAEAAAEAAAAAAAGEKPGGTSGVGAVCGVRDLKAHATQLVARAERGDRIVVSRYGKPVAALVPITEGGLRAASSGASPRMRAWLTEKAAFDRLAPGLEKKHAGRYVAVHGGRVVLSDASPDALFERAWKKLGGRTFFIGRVGAAPRFVDMPSVEVSG